MDEEKKQWSGKTKVILALVLLVLAALAFKFMYTLRINSAENGIDYQRLHELAQSQAGMSGDIASDGFDPMKFLTTWNFNNLPPEERSRFYKETVREDGTLLREYWMYVEDKSIEIAPGIFFPAWTYNGQVPGGKFTYDFTAEPFGTHLYHCHGLPLTQHISKGLYGAYIVDPKNDTRPKPDKEMVMVMNGFDTDFDGANDVYAVNTAAFYYANHPIKIKKGELVRIHLSNLLEFDMVNSFHLHANFFDEYPTGTKLDPDFFTDTTVMGQGQRSILDIRFKYPGMYMFHAHKTEFAELGWNGMFEVEE